MGWEWTMKPDQAAQYAEVVFSISISCLSLSPSPQLRWHVMGRWMAASQDCRRRQLYCALLFCVCGYCSRPQNRGSSFHIHHMQ